MAVMVTGGTGFIGNRIIRKLIERGEEVVCFDLAPPRSNLAPYLDRIRMYRGDVTQLPHLLEAINTHQVHKIIHLAALLPPDTEDRPHYAMQVNIGGANNVFEAARWSGIERVVYASSIAVYGVQDTFGERPINEDDLNDPINVYGMTKSVNDFSAKPLRRPVRPRPTRDSNLHRLWPRAGYRDDRHDRRPDGLAASHRPAGGDALR